MENACKDIDSVMHFTFGNVETLTSGDTLPESYEVLPPKIFNQGEKYKTRMACTRYSPTHGINAQNKYVSNYTGKEYTEVNPETLWDKAVATNPGIESDGDYIHFGLSQCVSEGLLSGYAVANTISDMKSALVKNKLLCTWSANGDWDNVRNKGVYRLRQDGVIVGHAFIIVGFKTEGWVAINSYWESNGVFIIPYSLTESLFNRYAIYDKMDESEITNYKKRIMSEITIQDAKDALVAKLWNGENPQKPASREEVAAMVYRALLSK